MTKLSMNVPMPSVMLPTMSEQSLNEKKYCRNPDHLIPEHCLESARKITAPINGDQTCLFEGIWNAHLMFRDLMGYNDPQAEDRIPQAAVVGATQLWGQYSAAVNGCVDYICEHGGKPHIRRILEVYGDYGGHEERGLALAALAAIALREASPEPTKALDELQRSLRIQIKEVPLLNYLYAQACAK